MDIFQMCVGLSAVQIHTENRGYFLCLIQIQPMSYLDINNYKQSVMTEIEKNAIAEGDILYSKMCQYPSNFKVQLKLYLLLTCAGGDCKGLFSSSNTCNCTIFLKQTGITSTLLQEKSNFTKGSCTSSKSNKKERRCHICFYFWH